MRYPYSHPIIIISTRIKKVEKKEENSVESRCCRSRPPNNNDVQHKY